MSNVLCRSGCVSREMIKLLIVPHRTKYYKKHWNDKFRTERGRKVWKVNLPDFDHERKQQSDKLDPEEIRSRMKEKGIAPPNPWTEREMYYPSSMMVLDPYVPDSDGQTSIVGKLKGTLATGKSALVNRRALSVIKNYEGDDFNLQIFAQQSLDIYVKAHQALADKDDKTIFEYVSERGFTQMKAGLDYKTIHWKFHGSVHDPVIMQIRVGEMMSKLNKMAQITVKLHTRQTLAIYDRHGRLTNGSPTEIREVVEYLVYEKLLSDEYGLWRIHDRLVKPYAVLPHNQNIPTFAA